MNWFSSRLELGLFLLILLTAGVLRFAALDEVPPGLTHDEADHGVDAAGVLEGRTPIYFTVGYGREPLYDYSTAAIMALLGRTYLASRITSALYGMALLVLVYLWGRRATRNPWLALAMMAGLAVSFWALQVSRHALRTITMPVLYMAAALIMWHGISLREEIDDPRLAARQRPQAEIERWLWFVVAGILLGAMFYTYLAARVMWAVFPAFFVFLSISQPRVVRSVWPGLLVMLAVAGLMAAPLAIYLYNNPGAEVRIGQLSGPLTALLNGDPDLLLANIRAGLGMLTLSGDDLWLYNVPGRPLLGPLTGILFYLGVGLALVSVAAPYRPARRGRRTPEEAFWISGANAFMLLTLAAGLVPALITGVSASNTRVIGSLPALYYFPALAVLWLAEWAAREVGRAGRKAIWLGYGVILVTTCGLTIRDYFVTWANAPDVRVAYHTTLIETLNYLDTHKEVGPSVALSTISPSIPHDPAVAAMRLRREDLNLRWFDGRSALLVPSGDSVLFIPEFAQLTAELQPLLNTISQPLTRLDLRPDDKNQYVEIWRVRQPESWAQAVPLMTADSALALLAYEIAAPESIVPGDTFAVLVTWRVEAPYAGDVVLFTHLLSTEEVLVAQQDLLSVPTSSWRPGDVFVQIHWLTIPADQPPGQLAISVGAYTRPDIVRLPLSGLDQQPVGDHYILQTIEVNTP